MSVMLFARERTDYARSVAEFLHDFEKRTSEKLETVDPDSRRGADLCMLYDVVEYPTIVAVADDGQLRNMWRGLPLPTIDEVSYYAR